MQADGCVRIGVIDSGLATALGAHCEGCAGFKIHDHALWQTAPGEDLLGHGTRVAEILVDQVPSVRLWMAQVFQTRAITTPTQVAAAIDWLVAQRVELINLSLGLHRDSEVLRQACYRALRAGTLLCAASPARGEPTFPACYPGVFRMTGDARCARDEISHLDTAYADFGACVLPINGERRHAGASLGCAHLSARIANYLSAGGERRPSRVRDWLMAEASYRGPEQRRAGEGQ
ncbi:peptidase S8/S53 subtilisin kexin sedolisin [Halomonas sp. KAO]|uniref:subtilisin-like serine protease QhpE n=1 Tax=Halomonas sp. KAO TaxID=2783858 RepID=UPI00189FA3D3|nr:S8 family serine peptidase [Halomonas sp. KAO]MBF7053814.1 peptidase S8/S53 subtilisin kexin sedolisin [Halomonas sp. KAO]